MKTHPPRRAHPALGQSLLPVLPLFPVLLVLGYHQLDDLDLGWHLAGGLWMLAHGVVPSADPFSALGRPWVAYSWLPELALAGVFKLGGFTALRLLQLFLVMLAGLRLFSLLAAAANRGTAEENRNRAGAREAALVLSALVGLLFLAPVAYLRPQFVSVIFLCVLLTKKLAGRGSLKTFFLLTVFWANVHVFWIFAPISLAVLELAAKRFREAFRCALLLTAAGLVSPYGIENIRVLFHYGFSHSVAYSLIEEFQPVTPASGFPFAVMLISAAILVLRVFSGFRSGEERGRFLLAVLFGAATMLQKKYLPFYGVVWCTLLCDVLLRHGAALREARSSTCSAPRGASRTMLAVLSGVYVVLAAALISWEPAVSESTAELIELAGEIPVRGGKPEILLQSFNEGGWIILGIALKGKSELVKTVIDGRTLVMGEERLADYRALAADESKLCATLEKWGASGALLGNEQEGAYQPSASTVQRGPVAALLANPPHCRGPWTLVKAGKHWAVLRGGPPP